MAVDRRRPGQGLKPLAREDSGFHRLLVSLGIIHQIELVCRLPLGCCLVMLRQLRLSAQAAFAVVSKLVQPINGAQQSTRNYDESCPVVGPATRPVRVDARGREHGCGPIGITKARSS